MQIICRFFLQGIRIGMAELFKKSQDFYAVLEVADDACFEEIKKAYHSCAFKYHPDRNPGNKQAEERFKEIGRAYAVLRDSDKKEHYDRLRQKNQAISSISFEPLYAPSRAVEIKTRILDLKKEAFRHLRTSFSTDTVFFIEGIIKNIAGLAHECCIDVSGDLREIADGFCSLKVYEVRKARLLITVGDLLQKICVLARQAHCSEEEVIKEVWNEAHQRTRSKLRKAHVLFIANEIVNDIVHVEQRQHFSKTEIARNLWDEYCKQKNNAPPGGNFFSLTRTCLKEVSKLMDVCSLDASPYLEEILVEFCEQKKQEAITTALAGVKGVVRQIEYLGRKYAFRRASWYIKKIRENLNERQEMIDSIGHYIRTATQKKESIRTILSFISEKKTD